MSAALIRTGTGGIHRERTPPQITSHILIWGVLCVFLTVSGQVRQATACESQSPSGAITIHVPAAAGGGWDLTAKVIRSVLLDERLADDIRLVYSPGAGGLIGLAQFIEGQRGNGGALLVGGMFITGSVALNQSSISLLDATPIARLTTEPIVVAVPVASPIQSLQELVEIMLRRPSLVSWVGGSLGGADQQVLLSLRRSLGIPSMRYHPLPGGGVGKALASGRFTAGLSGYSELEYFVRNGDLRLLAVSADRPRPDIGIPTFKESGIDVALVNWRGVFAAPKITEEQRSCWLEVISAMVASDSWHEAVKQHHWEEAYLEEMEFSDFIRAELEQTLAMAGLQVEDDPAAWATMVKFMTRRHSWLLFAASMIVALALVALWQMYENRRKENELGEALSAAHADSEMNARRLDQIKGNIAEHIDAEFHRWGLSPAERDVAMLMLKGLRLKDIAALRHTSERTVRQQALSIYKKGGLDGRSDLAAHFLEDFIGPERTV